MNLSKQQLWDRFQKYYAGFPTIGMAIDLSRMNFSDDYLQSIEPRVQKAFAAMAELEKGAIANPDENRMVGHYWLRNPSLAPNAEIRGEIEKTLAAIKEFAADIHAGVLKGSKGPFRNLLLIGIGGSALGPQFVSHALSHPARDKMRLFTFDNTDPDGMERVLESIGIGLGETLCVVVSKSGGTKETRNGMLTAKAAYEESGLEFAGHAVAVTQQGSELDKVAVGENWIQRFPMWDWVGGRTSELSAVGLLPAALQGFDIDAMLAGARECDALTRKPDLATNPAAQLATTWFYAGNGKGDKIMVVLPYKDRLELFSKYLQQLVMESIGKELDLTGKVVNQGLSVFGNKGSTDQHAYVQQLRDGLNNFFVTFIEVLRHRDEPEIEVEPKVTAGDYLMGFLLGTRQALFESGRESVTITIDAVTPFSVGALIALFERAVGLYASMIGINAYHQPGVEAGKKAASAVIELQKKVMDCIRRNHGQDLTAERIASLMGQRDDVENVFKVCEYLASNPGRGVRVVGGSKPSDRTYRAN